MFPGMKRPVSKTPALRRLPPVRRNGTELPPEHGAPVRLVIPHLYGYKSVKWFRGWEYLYAPRRGFWEERGYHIVGDVWTGRRYSYEE